MLRNCLLPLVVLWLVGCAELTTPVLTPAPMSIPTPSAYPQEATDSLEKMLSCFEQATMTHEDSSQEKARLTSAISEDKKNEDNFYESFRLACMLGRTGASDVELTRALALLEGLARKLKNTKEKQIVHLLRRTLILQQQLHRQQRQTLILKDKIEQLKDLERDLEHSPSSVGQIP